MRRLATSASLLILSGLYPLHALANTQVDTVKIEDPAAVATTEIVSEKDPELSIPSADANSKVSNGQYREAIVSARKAAEVAAAKFGKTDLRYANALSNQAVALKLYGDLSGASAALDEAIAIKKKAMKKDDPLLIKDLNNLGGLYLTQKRFAEAEAIFSDALKRRDDKPNLLTANILTNLGLAAKGKGDVATAEARLNQAREMKREVIGPDNIEEAIDLNNLGNLFFETGKLPLAAEYYRKAIAVKRASYPATHPSLATSLNNLGSACIDLQCYSEAETALKEALRIRQASLTPEHPAIKDTLNNLAALAEKQGKFDLARNLRMQAMSAPAQTKPGRI